MENDKDSCCFNKLVECRSQTNCERCGWNPEVSKKRIKHLRKQRILLDAGSTRRLRV